MRGWKANGVPEALWEQPEIGTRDRLAELSGVDGQTLSSINQGKRGLTPRNADRLIAGAAKVGVVIDYASLRAPDGFLDAVDLATISEVKNQLAALSRDLAELKAVMGPGPHPSPIDDRLGEFERAFEELADRLPEVLPGVLRRWRQGPPRSESDGVEGA